MPLLLPNDAEQEGAGPDTLSEADLAPLLAAARAQERARQQARRQRQRQQQQRPQNLPTPQSTTATASPHPPQPHPATANNDAAPPTVADRWGELMGRRCPAVLARSLALAQHGTLRDLVLNNDTDTSLSSISCLYVSQHEYAVLGPTDGPGPALLASDEATTCHLVALREPVTGVVGLAHIDSEEAVADLGTMEGKVWAAVAGAGGSGGGGRRALDLYMVGGYDAGADGAHHAGGELLTATILAYFASLNAGVEYRLQVALVSSTNTTALPSPAAAGHTIPAPRCRSLGFCLRTGQAFTGAIPDEMKGPLRALRALRLWGWGARNMVEVGYRNQGEGGSGTVVVAPFRYHGGPQAAALLAIEEDAELVRITSTSPEVEAPTFARDMRETLRLLVSTLPEEFFGPAVSVPAEAPIPLVDLREWVSAGGAGGGGGN